MKAIIISTILKLIIGTNIPTFNIKEDQIEHSNLINTLKDEYKIRSNENIFHYAARCIMHCVCYPNDKNIFKNETIQVINDCLSTKDITDSEKNFYDNILKYLNEDRILKHEDLSFLWYLYTMVEKGLKSTKIERNKDKLLDLSIKASNVNYFAIDCTYEHIHDYFKNLNARKDTLKEITIENPSKREILEIFERFPTDFKHPITLNLKNFDLNFDNYELIFNKLRKINLEGLNLVECNLNGKKATSFLSCLKISSKKTINQEIGENIKKLVLKDCDIPAEGISCIEIFLKSSNIKLENLKISSLTIQPFMIKKILKALIRNTTVKNLILKFDQITPMLVNELSCFLKNQKSIKSLSLSVGISESININEIANGIKEASKLETIKFKIKNVVPQDFIIKIMEAVLNNKGSNINILDFGKTKFKLDENNIKDFEKIKKALEDRKIDIFLDLNKVNIN